MAQIEGNSSFAFPARFAIIEASQNLRDDHGTATTTELRILRQGPPAECDGGADMHLRMHVLRGLRRDQASQCVPELRRRFRAAADQAFTAMAARGLRDPAG